MKTLKQIAQLVTKLYAKAKEPDERELDYREAIPYIKSAASSLMQKHFFQFYSGAGSKRDLPAHYKLTYENVPVLEDDRGRNYAEIPAAYLSLQKDLGIRQVLPVSKKDLEVQSMIIISEESAMIMKRLDAGAMEMEWVVMPLQGKLLFKRRARKTLLESGIHSVDITLLAATPDDLTENDAFTLPEEYHNEVILQVFRIMQEARGARISMDDVRELQQDLEKQP